MNATPLIPQRQCWQHFIGGYYSDTETFLAEAKRQGISRRAPARAIRNMQFGDRLVLLRYVKREAYAFADAIIVGMTLEHDIADAVGRRLQDDGLAVFDGANAREIQRECGSYSLCGTWTVKCSWSDVISIAQEIADQRNEPLFVMVNASITQIYDGPIYLKPSPKFTRGFTRLPNETEYLPQLDQEHGYVHAIKQYHKAMRSATPKLPAGQVLQ